MYHEFRKIGPTHSVEQETVFLRWDYAELCWWRAMFSCEADTSHIIEPGGDIKLPTGCTLQAGSEEITCQTNVTGLFSPNRFIACDNMCASMLGHFDAQSLVHPALSVHFCV